MLRRSGAQCAQAPSRLGESAAHLASLPMTSTYGSQPTPAHLPNRPGDEPGRPRRDGRWRTLSRCLPRAESRHHALATASVCFMTDPSGKPLPIRVPAELVERIDRLRGLVPREAYVRHLLDQIVTAEERKSSKGAKR